MNPNRTYSDYIERYGEVEGKILFLDLCEVMGWDEMIREIKNENDESNRENKYHK